MMRGYNVNTRKKRHIHGKGWLLLFVMVFVLSHGQQIQAEEYGTESQSGTEQTADGALSEEFLEASEEGEIQLDYTQGSYDIVDAAGLLSESGYLGGKYRMECICNHHGRCPWNECQRVC